MTYDIHIVNVGGGALVHDITDVVTAGQWTRRLDTWDEAAVKIGPMSRDCCDVLADVRPWAHELLIRLDGETVFNGPIIAPAPGGSEGRIAARGMAHWLAVRRVRDPFNSTGAPVNIDVVVSHILSSALSVADPNLLTGSFIVIGACDVLDERLIDTATQPYIAWDILRSIVGTYMHMSSFGRQIRFWCMSDPCLGVLPTLPAVDQMTETPVVFDGDEYASGTAVWNGWFGADSVVGYAGGIDPYYGILVERVYSDATVVSAGSAALGASGHVRADSPLITGQSDNLRLRLRPTCTTWNLARVRAGACAFVEFTGCFQQGRYMQVTEIGSSWDGTNDQPYVVLRERVE